MSAPAAAGAAAGPLGDATGLVLSAPDVAVLSPPARRVNDRVPAGPGAPPAADAAAEPADPARRWAARAALLGAVALGVLADLLFRDVPLGLNLVAWTAAALVALGALARRLGRPVTVGAALLGALALGFAGLVAWRDAGTLVALDVAALATALAALARALRHGNAWAVEHADAAAYVAGGFAVAGDVLAGAAPLAARDAAVGELRGAHRARAVVTVARGLFLAAPLLLVFALLLTAADGAFQRLVERAVDVNVGAALDHAGRVAVAAWLAAGFAAGALFARAPAAPAPAARNDRPRWFGRATPAEVCVALGMVDALFLAFVVVQLGWLFGGRAVVGGAGVTYAEYARRGFFELAAVAALSLPLLVTTRSAVARAAARGPVSPRVRRAYRAAAGLLIALVAVMLASAADRMRLYQAAHGLTELRLYVSAFMAWLLAVFAWAACTLLRERPAPFALGALLLGWTWVLGLSVVNPAALVVRVNVGRAERGRPLDASYLAGLGADAVPALAARAAPFVPRAGDPVAACEVDAAILGAASADDAGWRGWNVARARAAGVAAAYAVARRAPRDAAGRPRADACRGGSEGITQSGPNAPASSASAPRAE